MRASAHFCPRALVVVLPLGLALGACTGLVGQGLPLGAGDGGVDPGPADASTTVPPLSDAGPGPGSDAGRRDRGGPGGDDAGPPPPPAMGLRAEYFSGYLDLALERVEPNLDHDWADGAAADGLPADRFSARFTGELIAPASGNYTLAVESDDGIRLWVDGQLLIEDWTGHFVTRHEAQVALTAGQAVALRIDYFEYDLGASLRLLWSSEQLPEEVVPTEALRAAPEPSGLAGPKPPYANPVVPFDCPDPGVMHVEGEAGEADARFVMVCTGGSFPIRTSRTLLAWEDTGAHVLPDGKPAWAANGGRNWAPEIHRVGDRFVAYYTSVNGANVLSIGAAATEPGGDVLGPYVDRGGPLVEHPQGVIDASFFEDDDGSRWLLYKIDGNSVGQPTPIYIQQLTENGLDFAPGSQPVEMLRNDRGTWEGGVVEAPWLVKRDGSYFLYYSGNVYDSRYRTGVARAWSLGGPYERMGAPLLGNNERWVGPGHGSIIRLGDVDYFVYHAWSNNGSGGQDGAVGRQVLVDRIDYGADGWPHIGDGTPSRSPQGWPGAQ